MRAHLHTPGHHGDTQGWGAPDLSDDQVWAPAPTYPWASPFVLNPPLGVEVPQVEQECVKDDLSTEDTMHRHESRDRKSKS